MSDKPIIRIFPHKTWFPKDEDLKGWMHFTMRNRGGTYYFRKGYKYIKHANPPGTLVLFRYEDSIVGDGIVKIDTVKSNISHYEIMITFEPTSLRIYRKPLPVKKLSKIVNKDLKSDTTYYSIPMKHYGEIMTEVVHMGGFI
jgi:hypothetical protein